MFFRGGEHHSMNRDRGGGGRGGGGGGGWGRDGQMDLKVLFISLQGLNLNVSMFNMLNFISNTRMSWRWRGGEEGGTGIRGGAGAAAGDLKNT